MVNKMLPVKISGVAGWASTVLRDAGIEVVPGHDEALILPTGERQPVDVKALRLVDVPRALAILHQAQRDRLLVIADQMTVGATRTLEEQNIDFVTADGRVQLDLPSLVIRTTARASSSQVTRRARLTGKSGLVAEAMLVDRNRTWKIADLATTTGVSDALVHRVLTRLDADRVTLPTGAGPRKRRRLDLPDVLLDTWADEEELTAYPPAEGRGHKVRRTAAYWLDEPGDTLREITAALDRAEVQHAIGGVAAAMIQVPALTSRGPVTIWIEDSRVALDKTLHALDARAVETGANLVIAQGDAPLRLRKRQRGVWVTSDPRTYLDSMRDPRRGAEEAREFRSQVLLKERV